MDQKTGYRLRSEVGCALLDFFLTLIRPNAKEFQQVPRAKFLGKIWDVHHIIVRVVVIRS
ncbi:hypothetical protein KCTC52924_02630 [Arenibacter antarcticus]